MSKHQGLQPPAAVIAIAKDYPNVQNPILYRANNVSISIPRRQGTGALQGHRPILVVSVSGSVTGVRRQNSEFMDPRTPNSQSPKHPNTQTPKRRYADTPTRRRPAAHQKSFQRLQICHDFLDVGVGIFLRKRRHLVLNSTLNHKRHMPRTDA
jgi:hypothetical protein